MKNQVDCVEEYVSGRVQYRTRVHSNYLDRMIRLTGKAALHKTPHAAIRFGRYWLIGI